jgi:hypothetical protein
MNTVSLVSSIMNGALALGGNAALSFTSGLDLHRRHHQHRRRCFDGGGQPTVNNSADGT